MSKERFISQYGLRKENGCFDINKALELEQVLLKVQKDYNEKLTILRELLGDKE